MNIDPRIRRMLRQRYDGGGGGASDSNEAHSPPGRNERCRSVPAIPVEVLATQVDLVTQNLQKELEDLKQMMKTLMPMAASQK
ncbi:hypothetical protein LIER_40632 [Lithospermum erythrorhizon]|uniref:Uncharacterized protein n=1 Tax=Lithospermum erythrorhizon TaxID=34254 RepID=A0AAV3R0F7_LITER